MGGQRELDTPNGFRRMERGHRAEFIRLDPPTQPSGDSRGPGPLPSDTPPCVCSCCHSTPTRWSAPHWHHASRLPQGPLQRPNTRPRDRPPWGINSCSGNGGDPRPACSGESTQPQDRDTLMIQHQEGAPGHTAWPQAETDRRGCPASPRARDNSGNVNTTLQGRSRSPCSCGVQGSLKAEHTATLLAPNCVSRVVFKGNEHLPANQSHLGDASCFPLVREEDASAQRPQQWRRSRCWRAGLVHPEAVSSQHGGSL